jgi:hypothetical protein
MIKMKDILREYRETKQIVFVTGTVKTGINFESQRNVGRAAIQNQGYRNIKIFHGDTKLAEDGSSLYDYLKVNNVHLVILFSVSCQYANRVASIVGADNVYCIEPWCCPRGERDLEKGEVKSYWNQIDASHFYVNSTTCNRGNGAQENIPESNFTPRGTGHVASLTWAIGNIL